MKKRIPTFVAGMLTTALIGSIGVTALAASGRLTITVDPINIQVNGQTFRPKDANGADVPVFAYSGTTYAPLRALAEAYGLEVGYDEAANMATVTDPAATPTPGNTTPPADYSNWSAEDEAAYQEFKGMWEVRTRQDELKREEDRDTMYLIVASIKEANYNVSLENMWANLDSTVRAKYVVRLSREYIDTLEPKNSSFVRFDYKDRWIATINLGESAGVQLHNVDDDTYTPSVSVHVN